MLSLVHFSFDLIEAGGLHALFFCDWPGVNDYQALIGAYRAIGARQATEALARIGELFPEGRPPANYQRRRRLLDGIAFRRGRRSRTAVWNDASSVKRVSRCLEQAI